MLPELSVEELSDTLRQETEEGSDRQEILGVATWDCIVPHSPIHLRICVDYTQ